MSIAEKLAKIAENEPKVYQAGIEQGKQDEYDAFWDEFQQNGNRTNYWYGFTGAGWNPRNLKPKYKVITEDPQLNSQFAVGMFYRCNGAALSNDFIDFSLIADKFDFSKVQRAANLFDSAKMDNVVADLSSAVHAPCAFAGTWGPGVRSLRLKVSPLLQTVGDMFTNTLLEHIEMMEGSEWACSVDFYRCTKLSRASITSIINALSSTTNGLRVTLSKVAVYKAFETSTGANDGSTSTEWLDLINTKPNWTVALI